MKLVLQVGRVQIPKTCPEIDKSAQAEHHIQSGMLREEEKSFATLFTHVGNFAEADEGGFFTGVRGGMNVGIQPARGVAIVADVEFEPEVVAEGDRSLEGAVVADFPGQKSAAKTDGNEKRGGEPALAALRRPRHLPHGIDCPGAKDRTKRERRSVGQRHETAEDSQG